MTHCTEGQSIISTGCRQ